MSHTQQERDINFLEMVDVQAKMGTCPRLRVGAVLVRGKRVLATAYNGAPSGRRECDHSKCVTHDKPWGSCADWNERARRGDDSECLQSDTRHGHCENALHAEDNIVITCAFHGISTSGAMLYLSVPPCTKCIRRIDQAGIRRVVYSKSYDNLGGDVYEYCKNAGISLEWLDFQENR